MIKLAAFDIDGTLFDEKKKEFPHSAVQALQLLQANHILVAAATGRPPASAAELHKVGIFPDYFVCSNGHLILDRERKILVEEGFPPPTGPRGLGLLSDERPGPFMEISRLHLCLSKRSGI